MGITLNRIHVFGNSAPADCGFTFRSFSPGWFTCIDDFSLPGESYKAAKRISKTIHAPVLYFSVYDSEEIWFEFFQNGKIVSRYADSICVTKKKSMTFLP